MRAGSHAGGPRRRLRHSRFPEPRLHLQPSMYFTRTPPRASTSPPPSPPLLPSPHPHRAPSTRAAPRRPCRARRRPCPACRRGGPACSRGAGRAPRGGGRGLLRAARRRGAGWEAGKEGAGRGVEVRLCGGERKREDGARTHEGFDLLEHGLRGVELALRFDVRAVDPAQREPVASVTLRAWRPRRAGNERERETEDVRRTLPIPRTPWPSRSS